MTTQLPTSPWCISWVSHARETLRAQHVFSLLCPPHPRPQFPITMKNDAVVQAKNRGVLPLSANFSTQPIYKFASSTSRLSHRHIHVSPPPLSPPSVKLLTSLAWVTATASSLCSHMASPSTINTTAHHSPSQKVSNFTAKEALPVSHLISHHAGPLSRCSSWKAF